MMLRRLKRGYTGLRFVFDPKAFDLLDLSNKLAERNREIELAESQVCLGLTTILGKSGYPSSRAVYIYSILIEPQSKQAYVVFSDGDKQTQRMTIPLDVSPANDFEFIPVREKDSNFYGENSLNHLHAALKNSGIVTQVDILMHEQLAEAKKIFLQREKHSFAAPPSELELIQQEDNKISRSVEEAFSQTARDGELGFARAVTFKENLLVAHERETRNTRDRLELDVRKPIASPEIESELASLPESDEVKKNLMALTVKHFEDTYSSLSDHMRNLESLISKTGAMKKDPAQFKKMVVAQGEKITVEENRLVLFKAMLLHALHVSAKQSLELIATFPLEKREQMYANFNRIYVDIASINPGGRVAYDGRHLLFASLDQLQQTTNELLSKCQTTNLIQRAADKAKDLAGQVYTNDEKILLGNLTKLNQSYSDFFGFETKAETKAETQKEMVSVTHNKFAFTTAAHQFSNSVNQAKQRLVSEFRVAADKVADEMRKDTSATEQINKAAETSTQELMQTKELFARYLLLQKKSHHELADVERTLVTLEELQTKAAAAKDTSDKVFGGNSTASQKITASIVQLKNNVTSVADAKKKMLDKYQELNPENADLNPNNAASKVDCIAETNAFFKRQIAELDLPSLKNTIQDVQKEIDAVNEHAKLHLEAQKLLEQAKATRDALTKHMQKALSQCDLAHEQIQQQLKNGCILSQTNMDFLNSSKSEINCYYDQMEVNIKASELVCEDLESAIKQAPLNLDELKAQQDLIKKKQSEIERVFATIEKSKKSLDENSKRIDSLKEISVAESKRTIEICGLLIAAAQHQSWEYNGLTANVAKLFGASTPTGIKKMRALIEKVHNDGNQWQSNASEAKKLIQRFQAIADERIPKKSLRERISLTNKDEEKTSTRFYKITKNIDIDAVLDKQSSVSLIKIAVDTIVKDKLIIPEKELNSPRLTK